MRAGPTRRRVASAGTPLTGGPPGLEFDELRFGLRPVSFTLSRRTVVIILVDIAALVVIGVLNTGIIGGEGSNTGGEGPVLPTLVVPR